jgi:hypothetical protein
MDNQPTTPKRIDEPDRPPPQGALPVWTKVYSKPGEHSFSEIINHPDATARNAYIWVFITGMLAGLINGLVRMVAFMSIFRQTLPGDQIPGATGILSASGLVGAICGAPLAGLISVISFTIAVALVHGTARFLGSKEGSFDQLAYGIGAVVAPFTLVSALVAPFNLIPYVVFCTGPLLLVLSIYVIYLQMAAVKAVYRTGWLEAAGAFFLPTILLLLLCACIALLLMRMAGPSVNDIFQQMQLGM